MPPTPALTVFEVSQLIKDVLAQHAPLLVRVVGEVSNFASRTHWFFSLKDEQATIRCVCFTSQARKAGFVPADGASVVATGRLDYYPAQGQLQLYVNKLEPVGLGTLEMRLRTLLEELRLAGYFDESRKKPLPLFPRKVAVVTSRSGAALQDVIRTAQQRLPSCRLYLLDVLVQGAQAAPPIARAIERLSCDGPALGIDAIILTRGGGSMEDLWAFNERIVADALYRCRLPVVAAIGHETDTTVAELVADLRASTPTQAVMRLLPDRKALARQIAQEQDRLRMAIRRNLAQEMQRLESLARNPLFSRPQNVLRPLARRLLELESRLRGLPERRLTLARHELAPLHHRLQGTLPMILPRQRQRLESLARQLQSLSPQRVLERGYSYTLTTDGQLLRKADQVHPGDRITTVLALGQVRSRVEPGAATPIKKTTTMRSGRPRADAADEPGLFGRHEHENDPGT